MFGSVTGFKVTVGVHASIGAAVGAAVGAGGGGDGLGGGGDGGGGDGLQSHSSSSIVSAGVGQLFRH